MPFVKENVNLEIDTMGVVLGQNHHEVVSGVSVGGPSKDGAVVESVAMVGTVATVARKLTLDFEAIIFELDQAIQSKPIISNSNSICEEQLMDKSNFYLGLVDIEVMDEDLTLCKRVSLGKEVVPCDASCLQGDGCDFNAGKGRGVEGTNLVRCKPKRSGFKIKSGSHTLQGPPASGSDGVIAKKPTSKASNSSSGKLDGLKKGTWKRAYTKSRPGLLLSLNNVLGTKRSGKEFSRETEKAELAKKKTMVSDKEGLYVHPGEDQITSTEVATQPRWAL